MYRCFSKEANCWNSAQNAPLLAQKEANLFILGFKSLEKQVCLVCNGTLKKMHGRIWIGHEQWCGVEKPVCVLSIDDVVPVWKLQNTLELYSITLLLSS